MIKCATEKPIIFIDFDGTITEIETFVDLCKGIDNKRFTQLGRLIYQGKITIKHAIKNFIESLSIDYYPKIINYIDDKKIRDGFDEFLKFCHENGIDIIVISGGLLNIVEKKLHNYKKFIKKIYAATLIIEDNSFKLISPYESENDLVAKDKIIKLYNGNPKIAIGDGLTDLSMAYEVDILFARGLLAKYCEKNNIKYFKWNNFFDIIEKIKNLLTINE